MSEWKAEWVETNLGLAETIDSKLSRHPKLTSEQRVSLRSEIIRAYLYGQNILDYLRTYPTVFEEVRKVKSNKERYLALESLRQSGFNNGETFSRTLDDFQKAVMEQVSGVGLTTVEAIAWEAVADWIIRCPLDFQKD